MMHVPFNPKSMCLSAILLVAVSAASVDESSPAAKRKDTNTFVPVARTAKHWDGLPYEGSFNHDDPMRAPQTHFHKDQVGVAHSAPQSDHFSKKNARNVHSSASQSAHLHEKKGEAAHKEKAAADHSASHSDHVHRKKHETAHSASQSAHVNNKKADHAGKKKAVADHGVSHSAHANQKKHENQVHAAHSAPQTAHVNQKKAETARKAPKSTHLNKWKAHVNQKKAEAAHNKQSAHVNQKKQKSPKRAHLNKKAGAAQNRHTKKRAHHTEKVESCEELTNHGTHFTVELKVGTPPQKFNVVADTGSDAILIPSCQCVENMYCSNESNCFTGTNKSSTFSYEKNKKGEPLNNIKMMFGSGPVQAVVASDKVKVGNEQVMMKDAILLMTDHMLNIEGPFEGICGLGLPASAVKNGLYRRSSATPSSSKSLKSSKAVSTSTFKQSLKVPSNIVQVKPSASLLQVTRPGHNNGTLTFGVQEDMLPRILNTGLNSSSAGSGGIIVKGFAETAGIDRFSMCFNDGAPGVLRLQSQKVDLSHGTVGQVHWGLDFRGISIGDKMLPVKMCDEMGENQSTPCGAIPDSGTTALMGPKDHILELFESICDQWDRCRNNHSAFVRARERAHKVAVEEYNVDPFELQNATKGMIFQMLLMDCHTWWVEGTGLDELPDLHFHVRGVKGTKQTLQLHGWSYVIETYEKDSTTIYKDIGGEQTVVGRNYTGGSHKVCSPAFSTMDYQTEKNGPVWILGTPLFYEYQVGYDYRAKPPAMSFNDAECGTCTKKTSLTSVDSESRTHGVGSRGSSSRLSRGRRPRQVFGKFRKPRLDVTQPL